MRPSQTSGEGLWATSSGWTWLFQPMKSANSAFASHNSIYFVRHYLLRTYAPGSVQLDMRLPNTSQKDLHGNKTYSMTSVPGKVGWRKGHSSWLLKDEEEFSREKPTTTKKAETVPLVRHCVPALETESGI